ncbi:restriction endonuclease subunit S [bacterium]|nr:restriction endonuclease subunit S [bacterium]
MKPSFVTNHLDIWTSALQKKSASGRGSNNKISLYGIKKLRELILELAVRGKLVPQDPNDEPATVLLDRILAEKERLIKEKKIKNSKKLANISEEERPFELPKRWEWVRLTDIAHSQAGFAFKSKEFNDQGSGLPLIRIRDVGQPFSGTYYEGEYRSEFLVVEGDYLISMDGEFRVAPWDNSPALLNQRVSRLIFFGNETVHKFIAISLQARLRELQGIKAYTTVDHLSGGQISKSVVGYPPLAEQHRIVTKVDELMSLCDQLEQQTEDSITAHQTLVETLLDTLTQSQNAEELTQNWNRISNHFDTLITTEHSIDQLKQTILQLAVMGKLVPQDPNDEPASVLLEKIAAEKERLIKEGIIKKQKPLPEISEEEKPFDLPHGWEWKNLSEMFAIVTDGDHQAPPKAESGIPFLVIGNLNTGKVLLDNCRFVPKDYFESLDWSRKPLISDLLYTVTGSFGIPIKIDVVDNFCVQRHVAILKSVNSTPRNYLVLLLKSKYAFHYATNIATGIAQKTVPLTGLRKMPIAIPPESEIKRIVTKANQLMTLCDLFKTRITDVQITKMHLTNAIVDQVVR